MTTITNETDPGGEVDAVIATATRAAGPQKINDRFHVVTTPAGAATTIVDLAKEAEYGAPTPRRKTGTYQVHDADSFLRYFHKHSDEGSDVWADMIGQRITGVIDAHEIDPGWEQHRVVYQVQATDAWKAWTNHDGSLLSQATFAEHIEDRAVDIIQPSAADMLELAQTFHATIGVSFESSKRLSSGERQLAYRETVDAKAGKAGQLTIPETFTLALKPFEGADGFKVTARLRYRLDGTSLRIGYRLERPDDVLREAFGSVVDTVDEGLVNGPSLRGTAPARS